MGIVFLLAARSNRMRRWNGCRMTAGLRKRTSISLSYGYRRTHGMLERCPDDLLLGFVPGVVGERLEAPVPALGIELEMGCQKGKTRRREWGFRLKDGRVKGSHGLPASVGGDSIAPWLATHKSFKKVLTAYRFAASC